MPEGEIDAAAASSAGVERLLQHGHDRVPVAQAGHAAGREGRHEHDGDIGELDRRCGVASSVPFICGMTTSQRIRSTAPFRRRTRWSASAPSPASSTVCPRSVSCRRTRARTLSWSSTTRMMPTGARSGTGPSGHERWPGRSYPPAGTPQAGFRALPTRSPSKGSKVCLVGLLVVPVAHLHGAGARRAAGDVELVVVVGHPGHGGQRGGLERQAAEMLGLDVVQILARGVEELEPHPDRLSLGQGERRRGLGRRPRTPCRRRGRVILGGPGSRRCRTRRRGEGRRRRRDGAAWFERSSRDPRRDEGYSERPAHGRSANRSAARSVRGAPGLRKPDARISGYLASSTFWSSRSSTAPSGLTLDRRAEVDHRVGLGLDVGLADRGVGPGEADHGAGREPRRERRLDADAAEPARHVRHVVAGLERLDVEVRADAGTAGNELLGQHDDRRHGAAPSPRPSPSRR